MSKQLSFVADEETLALIEKLKIKFRAPTSAAVFRKALALAEIAVDESEGSNGVVNVRGRADPPESGVLIPLRM